MKSKDKKWKTKPVKVEQTKTDSVEDAVTTVQDYKVGKIKVLKERKTMTIGETKLGVTLVISKDECKKLGFREDESTKEVIKAIKTRLKMVQ